MTWGIWVVCLIRSILTTPNWSLSTFMKRPLPVDDNAFFMWFWKQIEYLCDILVLFTLITRDRTQWISCDSNFENIKEYHGHLRLSTPSSIMAPLITRPLFKQVLWSLEVKNSIEPLGPRVMALQDLMSTSVIWGRALRRAQWTLTWYVLRG